MDTKKIGQFLRDLRHEQNLTQEELGEKLGATNKTISRWETGAYMPPVDILLQMSKLYHVSVNEILSGERISTADYQPKAEENIVTTLNDTRVAQRNSKKILIVCLSVILILAIASAVIISVLVGGNTYITVTFETNGGTKITYHPNSTSLVGDNKCRIKVSRDAIRQGVGCRIPKPQPPYKTNSSLIGWYTSLDENAEKWDFDKNYIFKNITLYAKWEDATDGLRYDYYNYHDGEIKGYAVVGASINKVNVDVIIPSYYNCEPVLAICSDAFSNQYFRSVTIPDTVREIKNAFYNCWDLTDIRFGKNLESIWSSFQQCTSLKNVNLPEVEYIGGDSFRGCKKLQSVVIPDSIRVIYSNAFSWCDDLTSVTLGTNVELICEGAFSNCKNLLEVHDMSKYINAVDNLELFPNALDVYKNDLETTKLYLDDNDFLFYDIDGEAQLIRYYGDETCLTLPADCKGKPYSIRDYAFYANNLQELTIGGKIKSMGKYAFADNKNLKRVIFLDGITEISERAFYNCIQLYLVKMSDTIESIETDAFFGCYKLNQVVFSANLQSISGYAFYDCYNIVKLNLPGNIKWISPLAFLGLRSVTEFTMEEGDGNYCASGNCLINTVSKTLIRGFGESVIPSDGSVTSISYDAFCNNRLIKSIHIPASIDYISSDAFYRCPLLKTFTIDDDNLKYKVVNNCLISVDDCRLIALTPDSIIPDDGTVTWISAFALTDDSYDMVITIPKSVLRIDNRAFGTSRNVRLKYDGTIKECAEKTEYGKDMTNLGIKCIECIDGEIYRKLIEY